MEVLQIPRFDPRNTPFLPPSANMLIVGPKGSGRKTFLRDMMYHWRHHIDMAFAAVKKSNSKKWPQPEYVQPDAVYDPEDVYSQFGCDLERMRVCKQPMMRKVGLFYMNPRSEEDGDDFATFSCMRSCINASAKDTRLIAISKTLHWEDSHVSLSEKEENVTWMVVFGTTSHQVTTKIYERFHPVSITLTEFHALLDHCQQYECLVLEWSTKRIFWYKTRLDVPRFCLQGPPPIVVRSSKSATQDGTPPVVIFVS
jgi:hypothetical protein